MNAEKHESEQHINSEISDDSTPQVETEGKDMSLPVVESAFIEENIPPPIVQALKNFLLPEEAIFVLFRLNSSHNFMLESGKEEKALIWAVVTGTRILLLAFATDGQMYHDEFDQSTVVEYQNGFGIDSIKIAERSLSSGFWEGKRNYFKEAVQLFPLAEYEKYLYLAENALRKHEIPQAVSFLKTSLKRLPTLKAYLMLLSVLSQQNQRDDALRLLSQALEFADLDAFLEELQRLFPDNVELLLYFAAVCEERRDWDACIRIYHSLIRKTPDFDLYFLKLGEMYNAKQEYESALDYYHKFIELRTASEKFKKGSFTCWALSEIKWFSADPDLVKAYFDIGGIYEYELNELGKAAAVYLDLLRHAPFYTETYKHFQLVYQQLCYNSPEEARDLSIHIPAFLQVYQLLSPGNYASTVSAESGKPLSSESSLQTLPLGYHKLTDAERERLIHPAGQEAFRKLQSWLTSLVVTEEGGEGIEEYCEQVTQSNYPEIFRTIAQISDFLDISPPKCFVSRGKIGMSIRNTERPFIFIGSEHLSRENERYFSQSELVFLIASKAEHIKSGHLLLTGTELWKSLGAASFEGFLIALQCLPAGGFLSKLTHHFATAGLKKIYKKSKYSNMQKLLDFFTKSPEQQTLDKSEAEQNGKKNDVSRENAEEGQDSLLIIEFARHAVYTADRAGILACNHVGAACSAIFKLAKEQDYNDMESISRDGLLHLLSRQDQRGHFLYFEYARRLNELIKFALSEDYVALHRKTLVVDDTSTLVSDDLSHDERSAQQILRNKLQVLEHSLQDDLLNEQEFTRKQQRLLEQSGLLQEEELRLADKLHRAFSDGILTLAELRQKLLALFDSDEESPKLS
ncbi:MAG: hypothetical protein GY801_20405 [bacterium]|nr:hypothetical protein [bacterium]